MKMKMLLFTILGIAVTGFAGCGGGGGGAAPTVVSGVASKGPVNGGAVAVYPITNGAVDRNTTLGTGETKADGSYSITLAATPVGPVLVEVLGGQFKDETTGTSGPKLFPLRAVVDRVTAGTNNIAVTGLTEIAVRKIEGGGNVFNAAAVIEANNTVEAFFGIDDIIALNPADVNTPGSPGNKEYGLALATLMQYSKRPDTGVAKAFDDFGKLLNGKLDPSSQVNNETLTQGIIAKFFEDRNTFLTDTAHNQSGITGITSFTAAEIKVSSQGTLPAGVKINGIQLTLNMPAGVTVTADQAGNVDTTSATAPVKVSGVAAAANIKLLAGAAKFTPATATSPNMLKLVFVSDTAASFDLGEFVTITCNIAAGSRITGSAFVISGAKAVTVGTDTSSIGARIEGVSVVPVLNLR
jgi:hypothetical protein